MYTSQPQQQPTSFIEEHAALASELHTIVDNLQPETPPQVEPPRRPFWQRAVMWQVPLLLVALGIILMYNSRVDNCNGFKITYKKQVLCISNDADFFLLAEHFTCDFIEKGKTMADSLNIDEVAQPKMATYYEKYAFSLKKQPIEAEVLRGMRGVYDSASFCKNLSKAYWNAGIRLLKSGEKDSACTYFNKIEAWSWGDSVLTEVDKSVVLNICVDDLLKSQLQQQADFAKRAQKDRATALNARNKSLNNINNVVKNRVNQRTNTKKIIYKIDSTKLVIANKTEQKLDTNKIIREEFYQLFGHEWTGEIVDSTQAKISQEYSAKKYAIYAQYDAKSNRIRVEYPSFPCSSEWLFVNVLAVKKDEFLINFTENLTNNIASCANNESIQIFYNRNAPNYCQIKYYHPKLGMVAQGYLRASRGSIQKNK